MVNRRNWIKLICLFLLTIVCSCTLIKLSYININDIIKQDNGFQYNAISMSSVIGGFLFTGIGILISSVDKERIKRLWENKYLDNLYRSAFIGMISNLVTIITAFIILFSVVSGALQYTLVSIEVVSIICGIVFFAWCIKQLIFVIRRMKK